MKKTRINRRNIRTQNKSLRKNRQSGGKNNRQRGGKTVLPMRFFSENFNKYYYENPVNPANQVANSHGVPINGAQMTAPDLNISSPAKQQGGGVLPAEYFGGNSGRYFEAGAPELLNCDSAYGKIIANSHGVVMDAPNGNWMAPNLAVFPQAMKTQTGGGKKKKKRNCCNIKKKCTKKKCKKYKCKSNKCNSKCNKSCF